MKTLTITFRVGILQARRQAVLEEMAQVPGVLRASFLKAESEHPEVARIAYVSLTDETDVEAVLARLRKLPEIEAASVPPSRRLI